MLCPTFRAHIISYYYGGTLTKNMGFLCQGVTQELKILYTHTAAGEVRQAKPFNLTFRVKQQSFCNILNIKVIQFHIRLTHPLEQGLSSTETLTS